MAAPKSAIRECRDQLFLDVAVGQYLSRVGSNLGRDRPQLWFHDDSLWRAVVRRGAVDYLQIANLFRDWLDVAIGPRSTVTAVLAQNAILNDEFVMVKDPKRLPQRGIVVINEGLPTSATYTYTFIDPLTGQMDLSTKLTASITANLNNADGSLLADALIGATSLTLRASEITAFPLSGFPMTLLLDAGTIQEEVVQLTGHASVSAPLTVSALTKNHYGPTASLVNSKLQTILPGSAVIELSDTSSFPDSGLIRITDGLGGPTELIEYYHNDATNNLLVLSNKLVSVYTLGVATVTLMIPGAKVQLAQLQVKGTGWDIFQSDPYKIQIFIPRTVRPDRLIDASFLHDQLPSTPSTTLAIGSVIGDRSITVADASSFPMAGSLLVGAERIGYSRIDRFQTRLCVGSITGLGAGSTLVRVDDVTPIYAARTITKQIIIGRGTANIETVTWISIDLSTNTIQLASGTVNAHSTMDLCEVSDPNVIHLTRPLTAIHAPATAVVLDEATYGGTTVEVGDPTVAPAYAYRFQGHYQYSPGDLARRNSSYETTLAENLAGPVSLATDQSALSTTLEVLDALLFDATGAFDVTVGRRFGNAETVETAGVVLRRTVTAAGITTLAGFGPAATTITLSVGGGAVLPQSPLGGPFNYRIIVDRGGANEEKLLVSSITGDVVTLSIPSTTIVHLAGENVTLVSDVIVLNQALAYAHDGIINKSQKLAKIPLGSAIRKPSKACVVEELRTFIRLASVASLPTSQGEVILNFGNRLVSAHRRLVSSVVAGATTLALEDTDVFPAANFYVEIDLGTYKERKLVTVNNTALDQLTVPAGLDYGHPGRGGIIVPGYAIGAVVSFDPGPQTVLEYTTTATGPNRIVFSAGIYLSEPHASGSPVVLNAGDSEPTDYGTDYPFYMPFSWDDQLKLLFTWGRAAGVQVVVINEK